VLNIISYLADIQYKVFYVFDRLLQRPWRVVKV